MGIRYILAGSDMVKGNQLGLSQWTVRHRDHGEKEWVKATWRE